MSPAGSQERSAHEAIDLGGCYDEIRLIARRLMRSQGDRRLMQPTELANEAAIRLMALHAGQVTSRSHLLALAARIARRALLDEVRAAQAAKRQPVPHTLWPDAGGAVELDVLDGALEELAQVSPDHARIVELRFMLGLTVEETAEAEGTSPRSIKRRWAAARAWLQARIDAAE